MRAKRTLICRLHVVYPHKTTTDLDWLTNIKEEFSREQRKQTGGQRQCERTHPSLKQCTGKRKADTTSAEEERRGGVFIIQRLRKIKTNGHESFVKTCNVFLLFASICIHILYCIGRWCVLCICWFYTSICIRILYCALGVKLKKSFNSTEIVRQRFNRSEAMSDKSIFAHSCLQSFVERIQHNNDISMVFN